MNDQNKFQQLDLLEKERKKIIDKKLVNLIITLAIVTPIFLNYHKPVFGYLILFSYISITIVTTRMEMRNIEKKYKDMIMIEIFKYYFTNIKYIQNHNINNQSIKAADLMISYNEIDTSDYISATYNNIPFEMADISINKVQYDDGQKQCTSIFKGQWYILNFHTNFKSNIHVIDKRFDYNGYGEFIPSAEYKKIQFEDIEFNNKYDVYALDEINGYYVLTPPLIEIIKSISQKIKGEIIMSFQNHKLYIGVSNKKDIFRINLFKPINIQEIHQNTLRELNDIINLINYLKLDKSIFRKEEKNDTTINHNNNISKHNHYMVYKSFK